MPRKELPVPRPIVNVDGTKNRAGMVREACILEIEHQGERRLQRFYITDLGFDRILLGYPWLSYYNPQINWKEGMVEGEITLQTTANVWERWKELRQKALAATMLIDEEEEDWEIKVARTNFAQEWAQEANKQEQTEMLPREYQRHSQVFDEEAAKRFPPSRPEDHAIHLKPGAPSEINCKVYPLTKQELVATREFLDKNLELGFIE